MKFIYYAIIPTILLLIYGCSSNLKNKSFEEKKAMSGSVSNSSPNNRYVYFDNERVMHTHLLCLQRISFLSENTWAMRKRNIDISRKDLDRCCHQCIDDSTYESLLHMVEQTFMMNVDGKDQRVIFYNIDSFCRHNPNAKFVFEQTDNTHRHICIDEYEQVSKLLPIEQYKREKVKININENSYRVKLYHEYE